MAAGFTPKFIQDFPLDELTQEQFLVIANETAKEMKWAISYISDSGLIAYTNRGMFKWNAKVKITIENGTASITSSSTGNEMVDWGKNKKNIAKFLSTFEQVKPTFSAEELAAKYQELKEELVPAEEDTLKLPPPSTSEQITSFFSIFKPTKGYFITPLLIDINILIFILMGINGVNVLSPDNESLLKWGANFRPLTLDGQSWRLITNIFLHIGILHLLMNMYALLFIGVLLEPRLGRARFISAYMLTGITASITSLYWHDVTISAGASGAIFGMYGVFLAMLTSNLIEKNARKALLISIAFFVGYNLLNGMKGGIDNAAHIGGLVSGLIIGYAFIPSLKKPEENNLKYSTIGILAAIILAFSFEVYKNTTNDIGIYDAKMKQFDSYETMALAPYKLPKDTPADTILSELRNKGIYYWNEDLKLLDTVDKLKLPDVIRQKDAKLREYCLLRIKSYELVCKSMEENTDQYNDQIENYNSQIKAIVGELNGENKTKE